jgi:hypothetical protein
MFNFSKKSDLKKVQFANFQIFKNCSEFEIPWIKKTHYEKFHIRKDSGFENSSEFEKNVHILRSSH